MHIYFWSDTKIENFLFYGYNILTIVALVATCIGLLALGIFMEWLGLVQAKIRHKELVERQQQLQRICPTESDSLINNQEPSTSTQSSPIIVTKKTVYVLTCCINHIWCVTFTGLFGFLTISVCGWASNASGTF